MNCTYFFQILKELLGPYYDMKLIPPHLAQEPNQEAEEEVDDKFSIQSLLLLSLERYQKQPVKRTTIPQQKRLLRQTPPSLSQLERNGVRKIFFQILKLSRKSTLTVKRGMLQLLAKWKR